MDDDAELKQVMEDIARRTRRRPGPQPIKEALSRLLSRRGYAQAEAADELLAAWQAAAGISLAARSRPGNLRRGVLEISAKSSSVVQELTFEKTRLLRELQTARPSAGITDLRFRVAAVD